MHFSEQILFVQNMMQQIGDNVLNKLHSMNIYHNDLKKVNHKNQPLRAIAQKLVKKYVLPKILEKYWR